VDASRFVPATVETRTAIRNSLGITPGAIVVGFFAKLSSNERDRKGTDIFAAAARALSGQLHNLTILIIGPGWDDLVSELSRAGVNCVWVPFVKDSARMPLMYQALDFYWVTARVEGGPVTLLEAMSTAVCCLTTAVGLARDIVESGVNGVIVPFDDVQAFVEQTLAYTAQVEARSRMGAHARQTILETMNTPITSQGVGEAYDVATSQFAARAGSDHATAPSGTPMPRAALDQVAILEDLAWAEALMLQGQRALALRILCDTWIRNPFSSLPPRYLLRNLLPQRLVRTIVRVKSSRAGASKDRGNGR
jgi:hypothetical protein